MSPRHIALVVAAVAVLGVFVYLFLEVRSTPAQAQSTVPRAETHTQVAQPRPEGEERPAPVPDNPEAQSRLAAMQGVVRQTDTPRPVMVGTQELTPADTQRANPKLDEIMDEANHAYDNQDFDQARAIAQKVLAKAPGNVRMLRVMVSSACIDGDKDLAQRYFEQLPKFDREQMKQRCERYGIAFRDPPQ